MCWKPWDMAGSECQTKVKAEAALETWFQLLYQTVEAASNIFSSQYERESQKLSKCLRFDFFLAAGKSGWILDVHFPVSKPNNLHILTLHWHHFHYFTGIPFYFIGSRLESIINRKCFCFLFDRSIRLHDLQTRRNYNRFEESTIFYRQSPMAMPWLHFVFETCNHETFPENWGLHLRKSQRIKRKFLCHKLISTPSCSSAVTVMRACKMRRRVSSYEKGF